MQEFKFDNFVWVCRNCMILVNKSENGIAGFDKNSFDEILKFRGEKKNG